MGEIVVGASHGQQRVKGQFVIVENWPKMLNRGDDDPQVHTLHSAMWINVFPEVMKEELGLLRGIKADVEL